ncbi:quinolinate synthase NadA [Pullulanibacillus sp. KACC 23026]|uniref:quinolinate synthase NadA n=1 Tax=Pullulanibacillus sp. KACC 23026 TaxID=3028315 RepID=UPI0023AFB33C|nr:quinolinate synthase NadA [Pullulanibacillus sp. KACC 23026]WEG12342.1 quinolinate synthase NadA [Pullulanibacillus sp. KACC 23026]
MSLLETFKQPNQLPDHIMSLSEEAMAKRVRAIKQQLGARLFIPGHHYQKDEVIQFADATGDSLQLAQISAAAKEAEYIVFCGVHFMAETADTLTSANQTVILPDMRAGCSMADMANIRQLEQAWERLQAVYGDTIIPITYVNSTAAIKAFCGRHGGATVTSSNAEKMLRWAFAQKERVLFLPDQHLGRNTAADMGIPLEQMVVWNPIAGRFEGGGAEQLEACKMILWKGHCSVHEKFTVDNIRDWREKDPNIQILVHPECSHEVVSMSDISGSTQKIIKTIDEAPDGSHWAIGTEMNLVNRLKQDYPTKQIDSLNPHMCPCLTMNRIDLPHLLWSLEQIASGTPANIITVPDEIKKDAKLAIERMFEHV